VHGVARFRIWPSQQVMRELPEGGVGGKRTRSGRRMEEGETAAAHRRRRSMGLDW
jgi:hypothetical protein